jgi:hypothetical protein
MIISKIDIETKGYKAKLSKKLKFYQGDSLHLSFTIMSELLEEIDSVEITDGIIPLDSPNIECQMLVENMSVAGMVKEGNEVIFNLSPFFTKDIGIRKLQIKIIEKNPYSGESEVFHTPPFEYEIAEPISTTPLVESTFAMVDYAIVDQDVIAPSINGVAYYNGVISASYEPTTWITGDLITSEKMNKIEQELVRQATLLDELSYKSINFNSLELSVVKAEKGAIITNPILTWSLNKTPTTFTLDGVSILGETSPYTIIGDFTTNKTWNLSASDGKTTSNKSISLEFLNGKYYGISSSTTYDDVLISTLTKVLAKDRMGNITVSAGVGEYIFFAIPSSFGTPTFTVGGFTGGFALVETLNYTNDEGHTEEYCIYKSDNDNLGSTTISIT